MSAPKKAANPAKIIAYKGFDKDFACEPGGPESRVQYEVGKTYTHDGEVEACRSGFHACEYPLDVLGYYQPFAENGTRNRFAVVEASGEVARHGDDSKIAAARLTVKAEIKIPELVSHAVKWILDRIDNTVAEGGDWSAATNTGNRSAATNTGYRSAATNTGDWSAATNTGDWSAATNTGDWSAATNTGNQSAATNTGDWSAATNTGDWSAATNTGNRSAATNTGNRSAATNTGNQSAATNTGYRSAATNTGYRSAATNTGDWSAATNTGNQSAATVEGAHSAAIATGYQGRAAASEGSAIFLVERNDDMEIVAVFAGIAGRDGIKPGVFYTLRGGKPVEVQP